MIGDDNVLASFVKTPASSVYSSSNFSTVGDDEGADDDAVTKSTYDISQSEEFGDASSRGGTRALLRRNSTCSSMDTSIETFIGSTTAGDDTVKTYEDKNPSRDRWGVPITEEKQRLESLNETRPSPSIIDILPSLPLHPHLSTRSQLQRTVKRSTSDYSTGKIDHPMLLALPLHTPLSPPPRSRRKVIRRTTSNVTTGLPKRQPTDHLPQKPQRRGSDSSVSLSPTKASPYRTKKALRPDPMMPVIDDLSSSSPRRSGHSLGSLSTGSSSGSPLSAAEIAPYVLARLPRHLQEQLDPESWKQIFSAAAEAYLQDHQLQLQQRLLGKPGSYLDGRDGKNRDHAADDDDDDACNSSQSSYISDITLSTGAMSQKMLPGTLTGHGKEKATESDSGTRSILSNGRKDLHDQTQKWYETNVSRAPILPSHDESVLTRTWHETSKSTAPKLPRRDTESFTSTELREELTRTKSVPVRKSTATRRQVSFHTVTVRSYNQVLDANPGTSCGPSVSIGWDFRELPPKPVPDAELCRRRRRSSRELVLPRRDRENLLMDLGYSSKDIARAVRHNLKIRNQRKQTVDNLPSQKMEEMVERSTRKVKRLLGFSRRPITNVASSSTGGIAKLA